MIELVEAANPEFVFDVGADSTSSVYGAEGEGPSSVASGAPAIFPHVYISLETMRFLADAAGEESRILEPWRANFLEVVGAEDVAYGGFDEVPECRVRREGPAFLGLL